MSLLARASRLATVARPLLRTNAGCYSPTTVAVRRLASAVFPSDRKYKSSHEWVKVDGDVATVGITDHAQAALGEIVFADLPEVGREVTAAEGTAAVESVKAAADIYSPIGGEIVEVNAKLEDTPDLINKKPHDEGWMFQLKIADPSELDGLLDSTAYAATLEDK